MNPPKRMFFVLGLVLALIAAACGDDDTVATGDTVAPVATAAPTTTTGAPATTISTTETPGEFEPVGTDLTTPLPAGDVATGEQLWDTQNVALRPDLWVSSRCGSVGEGRAEPAEVEHGEGDERFG